MKRIATGTVGFAGLCALLGGLLGFSPALALLGLAMLSAGVVADNA